MTKALLFWLLMLAWLVFGLYVVWPTPAHSAPAWYIVAAPNVLLFVLLGLIGWKVFDAPIRG